MIPAGKMRFQVTIERPSEARDSYGRSVDEWEFVCKSWAAIVPLSGTEAEDARQYVATATTMIKLRYRRKFKLTTKHRIVFRGRGYQIGYIKNIDELNTTVEVLCSEVRL